MQKSVLVQFQLRVLNIKDKENKNGKLNKRK